MEINFFKYQGTGNDFILIDNRLGILKLSTEQVTFLCHRRFGIGADGLILLGQDNNALVMQYYNSDGRLSTMCGNGGRCLTAFVKFLDPSVSRLRFTAVDGEHHAEILNEIPGGYQVLLGMSEIKSFYYDNDAYIINSGSPHYVLFVDDPAKINILTEARKIRFSETYTENGININFAGISSDGIIMRTYERGVEDETLSCGTGSVAVAVASLLRTSAGSGFHSVPVFTPGGILKVHVNKNVSVFSEINLEGPAVMVFNGMITI